MKFKLISSKTQFRKAEYEEKKILKSLGFSFDNCGKINEIDIEINTIEELMSLKEKCGYELVLDTFDKEEIITIFNNMEY